MLLLLGLDPVFACGTWFATDHANERYLQVLVHSVSFRAEGQRFGEPAFRIEGDTPATLHTDTLRFDGDTLVWRGLPVGSLGPDTLTLVDRTLTLTALEDDAERATWALELADDTPLLTASASALCQDELEPSLDEQQDEVRRRAALIWAWTVLEHPSLGYPLHLSIDDLPYQTKPGGPTETDPAEQDAVTEQLLATLADTPASIFVNCAWVRDELLTAWHEAGHTVGNHQDRHLSLWKGDAAAWAEGVGTCHARLASALPEPPTWFRYPYLHRGEAEARVAGEAALAAHGLQAAPISVATSEWLLAFFYDAALAAGDAELQADLAAAYVAHLRETASYARSRATSLLGREAAQVTLLHVNRLTARHLDEALPLLAADGARFVDLHTATGDPAYALPQQALGPGSASWWDRVDPLPDGQVSGFSTAEGELRAAFGDRVRALQEPPVEGE